MTTTTTTNLPPRAWLNRPVQQAVHEQALAEGFTPLQARVLAGRLPALPRGTLRDLVHPSARHVPRASALPDIDRAAKRLADAVETGEVLACVADHDADGISAATIVWKAMIELFGVPTERLHIVSSHRLKEGYGVSAKLVERILALQPRPTCCITVDQGTTDEARIAELAAHGIDTLVTDHHHVPEEGPPPSAVACVNPILPSEFGDPTICGAMVAWYVMLALHQELAARGWPVQPKARLLDTLSYAAVATCADCVDLGQSHANRWAVQEGLARIAAGDQPVWEAFAPFVRNQWSASAIAFQLAPRLNAGSRVGDAMRGVKALCAPTLRDAFEWVQVLDNANIERKAIQAGLTERALAMAAPLVADGATALCLPFYEGGHAGVHGIVASRVVEAFGLPTICLSAMEDEPALMTGSIRSIKGVHVKRTLDRIAREHPELELRYGGHEGAGGVRLARERVPELAAAWELAVADLLGAPAPPAGEHDGPLPESLSADVAAQLEALAPYGRGFPEPSFVVEGEVTRVAPLGRDGKHLQLDLRRANGRTERLVWFGSVLPDGTRPLQPGRHRFVVDLGTSTYQRGPGYDLKVKEWIRPGETHGH